MMVRCGACRTQFDVPGPGRFSCPSCGSVNMVRGGAESPPPGAGPAAAPPGFGQQPPGYPPPAYTPPPPPAPEAPSPKMTCPECEFSFIVGQIEIATCPNCGAEVETGWTPEAAE